MTRAGIVGNAGTLPWHLPDELRLFRRATLGGTVIMGRKTWQSLGRPLDQRRNLVVAASLAPIPGIEICPTFDAAVRLGLATPQPVWYIGGREIYRQALPRVAELLVSWVEGDYAGTIRFPPCDWGEWEAIAESPGIGFLQVRYRRKEMPCRTN